MIAKKEGADKQRPPLFRVNSGTVLPSQVNRDNFAVRNITPDPRLVVSIDTYTGIGEAIGAQRVTDPLRTAGKNVLLKRIGVENGIPTTISVITIHALRNR